MPTQRQSSGSASGDHVIPDEQFYGRLHCYGTGSAGHSAGNGLCRADRYRRGRNLFVGIAFFAGAVTLGDSLSFFRIAAGIIGLRAGLYKGFMTSPPAQVHH